MYSWCQRLGRWEEEEGRVREALREQGSWLKYGREGRPERWTGQKGRRSAGHVGMTYSLCSVCPWMGATL